MFVNICKYFQTCVPLYSVFNFYSTWFYFLSKSTKERGKKQTGKNLNIDRQFLKDAICIFFNVTLCNLVAWGGGGIRYQEKLQPISRIFIY